MADDVARNMIADWLRNTYDPDDSKDVQAANIARWLRESGFLVYPDGRLRGTPAPPVKHAPMTFNGVTYCGWLTENGVVGGCGQFWPCRAEIDRRSHPLG